MNVSVHIRLGDACDVAVDEERPKTGNMWRTGKRHCVSPRAYYSAMKKMRGNPTVLLASDDDDAIRLFKRGTFKVIVNEETREWFSSGRKTWVENRHTVDKKAVLVSLADLRLLAHGQFFIASACGYFFRVAYDVASFRHAHFLYGHSVDECAI